MPNVVEFLKSFRRKSENDSSPLSKDNGLDAILSMTAAEFRRQDLVLLVKSGLLNDRVFIISNPKCLKHLDQDIAAYLPEELEALMGKSPGLIRHAHLIKKLITGEILKEDDPGYVKSV